MGIYYKAVQPDGTDFFTGTVDYAALSLTGGRLPRLPGGNCCTDRVYHAADVPGETLVGGGWPCRLFVVAGRAVAQRGHKFGFRTLRVVGELEAWQALGPNGREVAELIDRTSRAAPEQITRMAAEGAAARAAGRDAAWAAAWAAEGLVVRDLITPEQFDALYSPWASVMDAPAE